MLRQLYFILIMNTTMKHQQWRNIVLCTARTRDTHLAIHKYIIKVRHIKLSSGCPINTQLKISSVQLPHIEFIDYLYITGRKYIIYNGFLITGFDFNDYYNKVCWNIVLRIKCISTRFALFCTARIVA